MIRILQSQTVSNIKEALATMELDNYWWDIDKLPNDVVVYYSSTTNKQGIIVDLQAYNFMHDPGSLIVPEGVSKIFIGYGGFLKCKWAIMREELEALNNHYKCCLSEEDITPFMYITFKNTDYLCPISSLVPYIKSKNSENTIKNMTHHLKQKT